jgi:hypothetical protein
MSIWFCIGFFCEFNNLQIITAGIYISVSKPFGHFFSDFMPILIHIHDDPTIGLVECG